MMSFEHFVCWDPEDVDQVMRIDADVAQPPVFMAVHTDEPLSFDRPEGRRPAREFLDDFVGGPGDVRAVVIGDSGSGKSHLVRWVELNLPPARSDLQVVSVPRSGTSLRWIVRRLIEVLPPDLQSDYHEKLVQTPESPREFTELELDLLTGLARALERSESSDDIGAALADGLRDFFLDPAMREHHVGEIGIVADLVRHIATPSGRDDRDERRRFEEADLHLDSAMMRLQELAAPTKQLLRQLQSNPDLRGRAVQLVNEQLDAAVAQTLGLGVGELTELLNGIRRYLKTRDQTLVLLIQDFVRAEGIDRPLLDALIESGDDLCPLRLLVAVTTGYFQSELLDTQKTRLDYIINLDQRPPLDEDNRLAPFAARYLNALRVDKQVLERWYEEGRAGDRAVPLPNACASCEHQEVCHAAFGSSSLDRIGDVGLYPLTRHALANMAQRTRDSSSGSDGVDPRTVLRAILRPMLGDRRSAAIGAGRFPDIALLESHGGPKLLPHVQEAIRNRSRVDAERSLALIELWSARPGEATQLPADLYRAFSLDPLTLDDAQPPPPELLDVEQGVEPTEPTIAPAVQRRLDVIYRWQNGERMTGVTDDLRRLVLNAVMDGIDWDIEGLEQTMFAGSRGSIRDSFGRTSIIFARQDTREASRSIKLSLPLADDPESQLRTTRALQGLVNFDFHGHWGFEDGFGQFLAVSEEVPSWIEHVVDQMRRLHDPEREWDPVESGVELLAIGAALASRPPQLDASLGHRLEAILDHEWPDPADLEVRSDQWRGLYQDIYRERADIRELVLSHASSMKGGQSGSMLDARRVVRPLRAVSRDWQMRAAPPERLAEANLPDRYRSLLKLHARVREGLADAAEDELARRLAWLDALRQYVPEGVERREVVESIERLREAIASTGLPVQSDYLDQPIDAFRTVQLDEAIRMTEELRAPGGSARGLLPRLAGARRGNAMRTADEFCGPTTRFLDDAESKLQSAKERIGGAQAVAYQYSRIREAFQGLEEALAAAVGS